jgi:type IV pilus assembly protein PilA
MRGSRRENGYTLVELMVVVVMIATLIAIAVPTFTGARARADDRAAESLVRDGFAAAKSTDDQAYANVTLAAVAKAEPAVHFVDGTTSADADAHEVSMAVGTSAGDDFVVVASRSRTGTCFAMVDHEHGASAYRNTTAGACRADAFDPASGWSDAWT